MNTGGHYFCDKCDEVAFGVKCRACNSPARFIPHPPAVRRVVRKPQPPTPDQGREWFNRMRALVQSLPK